ncbi:antibiotic biosynthesis monooxygenase family protein [Kordiimonas aquimaris]|uniref:antibiotic biosynthesis monooxygenase family protein n=1 Tax=Kordiimonas aquimaris TaxID=707591 RepID=UPI0021D13243|nr:hypothetical protein [Kordiimonas aquimaris]
MAIKRVWHGWTTLENADLYEQTLREHVAPSIAASNISGYQGIELLRVADPVQGEVAFITIMTFNSLENVIAFQGDDYTRAHVPGVAQKVLKRWDEHAVHYEVRDVN